MQILSLMYKDIITYKLANNVSQDHLLSVAKKVLNRWMTKQPGFIKWEICKTENGDYFDIVYWESKEDAKKAESNMNNIENANEWFACYKKDSISSKGITTVETFK